MFLCAPGAIDLVRHDQIYVQFIYLSIMLTLSSAEPNAHGKSAKNSKIEVHYYTGRYVAMGALISISGRFYHFLGQNKIAL